MTTESLLRPVYREHSMHVIEYQKQNLREIMTEKEVWLWGDHLLLWVHLCIFGLQGESSMHL